MPFKSKAQRDFMHKNHPELAKEFEKNTPSNLPDRLHKKKEITSIKQIKEKYKKL